jgi:hypothetical protein
MKWKILSAAFAWPLRAVITLHSGDAGAQPDIRKAMAINSGDPDVLQFSGDILVRF